MGAIALGMIAKMVVSKDKAHALATGAMTVVMYNAAREALASIAPGITLGEYMAVDSPGVGEYMHEINYQDHTPSDDHAVHGLYEGSTSDF